MLPSALASAARARAAGADVVNERDQYLHQAQWQRQQRAPLANGTSIEVQRSGGGVGLPQQSHTSHSGNVHAAERRAAHHAMDSLATQQAR